MTTDSTPESEPVTTARNSIEIDAPPARVWQIVSEVRNAPQWSGQAHKVFATGVSRRHVLGGRVLSR